MKTSFPNTIPSTLATMERDEPSVPRRSVLYTLVALLSLLLLWATFGHIDIVAVARGKLVPATYVKIVQPADSGIVKEILITEGQSVKAGQVLMRMDNAIGNADWQSLESEYHLKDLAIRRIDAELAGLPLKRIADDPESTYLQASAQYLANRRALESAIAEEQSSGERAREELEAAEQIRTKLTQTLPHYQYQEKAYQDLAAQGFTSRLMANEKSRDRISHEQDLRAQEATIQAAKASIRQSQQKIRQIDAEYRMRLQAERVDTVNQLEKLRQELAKQAKRNELLELKSPQDGVIKELATHTIGTVVSPGTILMTLVPNSEALRAEVWVKNDDIGFVHPDQVAEIKLIAYPFQKYGMLSGKVVHVSADAGEENKTANRANTTDDLRYRALIQLDKPYLETGTERLSLAPGMQVTAEVILGERSVLEYMLSPVQQAFQEAGRER